LGGEVTVGSLDVERLGVEVLVVHPLEALGAFRVGGVGEDLQELGISPGAAAIFRRAVALSLDAEGIALLVRGGFGFLDRNDVVPVVAEVVSIGEALDACLDDAVQRNRSMSTSSTGC